MIILGSLESFFENFLLLFIELFFAKSYGWGATSEYRLNIGDFAPTGAGWPKISGRRDRPPL